MAMRFRKSAKVAPGVKINVGKKSVGVSVGVKGAHVSTNTAGRTTVSAGVPGSGVSWSQSSSKSCDGRNGEKKLVDKIFLPIMIAAVVIVVACVVTIALFK